MSLLTSYTRTPANVQQRMDLVRQPSYIAALGDSITNGGGSIEQDFGPTTPFVRVARASGGALVPLINGMRGVSGNTSTQILARVGDIINLRPKPSRCFVMAGTNDCNGSLSMTTYKSNIQAIVAALSASGIEPILSLIPPKDANSTEVATINAWLSLYGMKNGIQVVDVYTPYQDGSTGQWAGSYDSDGTHPTAATCVLMGDVIWNVVKDRIQPKAVPLLTAHASDPYNLVTNGIFVGDGNADGTADNWSANSFTGFTSSDALVSGGSTVPGNWQKLTLNATGSPYWDQGILSGWSVGDTLFFGARVRATISGSERFSLGVAFGGGSPNRFRLAQNETESTSGSDGQVFSAVGVVPTGTTSLSFQLLMTGASSTGTVEFAQVTLRNLTTLGLV